MNKTVLTSFTILCLLSTAFLMGYKISVKGSPELSVRNVDTGLDYATIQEAINAPETLDGHTIFIDAGIYNEHVVVSKSVNLIGANPNSTIIDKGSYGEVVKIESDNVKIENLTISGGGWLESCIYVKDHGNISIQGNSISYSYGECLTFINSSNNIISKNTIIGAIVDLYRCSNSDLTDNDFVRSGLLLAYSPSNRLRNNRINGTYSFGVVGSLLEDYLNDIDESNFVNGKRIYYWINRKDDIIPADVGYVGLVNCTNITVEGLDLRHNIQGVLLVYTSDSRVIGNTIKDHRYAVWVDHSSNNSISSNIVDDIIVTDGIILCSSSDNIISYNSLSNVYGDGIRLSDSPSNLIFGNSVVVGGDFPCVIRLDNSPNNRIFHNNFEFADPELSEWFNLSEVDGSYNNSWDTGYPSGGNYWSDYAGVDIYSGPYQNETGSDGIGDLPYVIDESIQDNYPLMGMFSDFNPTEQYYVITISNSTISNFIFGLDYHGLDNTISFNVTGDNGTIGFCRVMIPRSLMEGPYAVLINGKITSVTELPISNSTYAFLYFTYVRSTYRVTIFSWENLLSKYIELLSDYQSLNSTYYELMDAYDELMSRFATLNSAYYQLSDSYTELLTNFNALNATYHALLFNYTELQGNYTFVQNNYINLRADFDALNTSYTLLNSSYYNLQSDYEWVNSTYNDLRAAYNSLNSSYNDLNAAFNDYKESTGGELSYVRNLMYTFIATTIILIATTVYFAIRKPKIKP